MPGPFCPVLKELARPGLQQAGCEVLGPDFPVVCLKRRIEFGAVASLSVNDARSHEAHRVVCAQVGHEKHSAHFFTAFGRREVTEPEFLGGEHGDGDGLFGHEVPIFQAFHGEGLQLPVRAVEAIGRVRNSEEFL